MNGIFVALLLCLAFDSIKAKESSGVLEFPNLSSFLSSKVPDLTKSYKINGCRVQLLSGSCVYTVLPQRAHCLTLGKTVSRLLPSYILALTAKEVKDLLPIRVSVFYINTCLAKVTFVTSAEGKLEFVPGVVTLDPMVAELSVPIPFGDYELTARGTWKLGKEQMTIKITRGNAGELLVSGSTQQVYIPVKAIGKKFDVDLVPDGGIKVLIENTGLDNFRIHKPRVHGRIFQGNYEFVFSGTPDIKGFEDAHVRVLVVKRNKYKNLAFLLELQDYSPVTLLRKMYGASINRITLLRDRNQTLALFVTNKPMTNFSQVLTAHGSSRWIHRDSNFEEGATLLVTLPFPKRKALDMKIQIFADGLGFTLPEGENLPADLAMGAISPSKILRVDKKDRSKDSSVADRLNKFQKMLILKFRYFLFNDTYVAAAEQLNAMEEELKELMPSPRPTTALLDDFLSENQADKEKGALDLFFKRSERLSEKQNIKRNSDKTGLKNSKENKSVNTLSLAEKLGLL